MPGWAATIFTPGDVIRDAFDVGRTWTWTAADPLCLGPLGIDPAESECEMEKVKRQICGRRWELVGWTLGKMVGETPRTRVRIKHYGTDIFDSRRISIQEQFAQQSCIKLEHEQDGSGGHGPWFGRLTKN